jgi:hypothetical protein
MIIPNENTPITETDSRTRGIFNFKKKIILKKEEINGIDASMISRHRNTQHSHRRYLNCRT